MDIEKITVLGGYGRESQPEPVTRVELGMGDIISIVGPTGSGKTALINDIGLFANENTPSRRRVLVNDELPLEQLLDDPANNPIALITQHTSFLSDWPVHRFLQAHAKVRGNSDVSATVEETLHFANQLTGEAIILDSAMTELSGGQTRALLIADAVVIGNSPIILLDEIENAGIDRTRALELLRHYEKIFIFVTHDPTITLFSDNRIVMKAGAMEALIETGEEERRLAQRIRSLDGFMLDIREKIRLGGQLNEAAFDEQLDQTLSEGVKS